MDAKPKKICFVGGPSTGKSTLAKYLTEELAKKNYTAEFVSEFARDFIVEKGGIKGPEDQLLIVKGQKEKEKTACSSNPEFVVCDVPAFLSHVYFHFLNDGVIDKREAEILKKIENKLWQEIKGDINSYDFVFFLPPEIPAEKDGVRLYTDKIEEISNRIDKFLHLHDIKHHELRGAVETRASEAFKIIGI
ncbi:MAG: ATP-binding protein [Candidatus Nealsonbacteria bacterium]|nr:ATP-binding protein [Candidatus Nealsonbacteria bacterium]